MAEMTRDDFAAASEREIATFPMRSTGKDVWLQTITVKELANCKDGFENASLMAFSLVRGPDGVALYSVKDDEDLKTLDNMRAGVAEELLKLINRHSGMNVTHEDAVKNSDESQSES